MKYKYSVNNDNQLLLWQPTKKKPVAVRGRFLLDKNNRLSYWLNEPAAWRRQHSLPDKIVFIGNWRLNSNYDLELILDENKTQFKADRLSIRGEIISVDRDALVFEIISYDTSITHIQLLKLSGFWQADEYNRLSFIIKKETSPDKLILEGSWQVNQNQQITYTCEKTNLKTKTKILSVLTFYGFWQISSSKRIVYIISKGTNSKFDFRAQIETPNVYPKEGVIKYRIGIGLKGLSPKGTVPKIISLYGVWKFSRALGLTFEMEYLKGEIHSLEFGAEVNFKRNNEIVFQLKNETDEDLGISLTFTHRFLKHLDARAFLRLKAAQEEKGIDVGVRIPF